MKNPYRLPDPGIQKSKKEIEKQVTLEEYYKALCELEELKEQYGIEDEKPKKEGRIKRAISNFFDRRGDQEKV